MKCLGPLESSVFAKIIFSEVFLRRLCIACLLYFFSSVTVLDVLCGYYKKLLVVTSFARVF